MGAYGGRKDIMEMVAPAGPMYQAGTLSGNPLAMTAGIETLKRLKDSCSKTPSYARKNHVPTESCLPSELAGRSLAATSTSIRSQASSSMATLPAMCEAECIHKAVVLSLGSGSMGYSVPVLDQVASD